MAQAPKLISETFQPVRLEGDIPRFGDLHERRDGLGYDNVVVAAKGGAPSASEPLTQLGALAFEVATLTVFGW
jgi:hypothetical protein